MSPERLYFANGQRLDAGDLRLEQGYHVDMRRRLNSGLFTPGVVNGLEVEAGPGNRHVTVHPGLALDPMGRELVLEGDPDPELAVPSQRPGNQAGGYFLVLRYDEEPIPGAAHPCAGEGSAPAPARVREVARLEWTADWPDHRACAQSGGASVDCGIVIALVLVDDSCQVTGVETAFRQYAYPVHLSQVQSVALEGEKDIDASNPKLLRFLIRGGTPTYAVLYLWGARFSSLYYTELASHDHGVAPIVVAPAQTDLAAHTHSLQGHTHALPSITASTGSAGGHNHRLYISRTVAGGGPYVDSAGAFGNRGYERSRGELDFVESVPSHTHSINVSIGGATSGPSTPSTGPASAQSPSQQHTHALSGATAAVGVTGTPPRSGAAYSHLNDLRIAVDGEDITVELLNRYLNGWRQGQVLKLGDGTQGHPLNADAGTGPLSLLDVGPSLGDGVHTIKLSVPSGGGKVLYNLYIA